MLKKLTATILAIVTLTLTASCNKDITYDEEITYSSTLVKGFKLKKNPKVLNHIDSVFFSIDLVNARIFNADSLPYGTKVDKLPVTITTDACSKVELTVRLKNGKDTIIDYLKNFDDSIDFSYGPVGLHLVSHDGQAERDYAISVNVHRMVPDSLYWNRLAVRQLPGAINPTRQKSVRCGDKAVCLTADASGYHIATANNPSDAAWETATPDFGFTPDIESLNAAEETLYILDEAGALFASTDMGRTWAATGETWSHIYGAYGGRLLGVKKAGGVYTRVTYPATTETAAPADFPVSATSALVALSNAWSESSQAVMIGGVAADGNPIAAAWGYDGRTWAKLSDKLPAKIKGASLASYKVAATDTLSWSTRVIPVLLSIGGEIDGKATSKVFISRDMGMTWREGDQMIQLPDYISARSGAQTLVFDSTITARSTGDCWQEYEPLSLPMWWTLDTPRSRAIEPITSWDCPYIYLIGGVDVNGNFCNTIWRGVINFLTFKPLQ